MEARQFAIGDIHGEYDKLMQVIELSKIDPDRDHLITLGDIVDRGPDSYRCVEALLAFKNRTDIKGNHDQAFFQGLHTGTYLLGNQGARETLQSYIAHCNPDKLLYSENSGVKTDFGPDDMPVSHFEFFKKQLVWHVTKENRLFVHGGFNRHHPIADHDEMTCCWDRDLFTAAMGWELMGDKKAYQFKTKDNFKEIFIGHTPTQMWKSSIPLKAANIYNLDTGCGKGGVLTIMNVETKQYFQSK